ncbi:8749_t:CDS:2 [Funneliformis geosporum]|uniref:11956_t:CDS:1 n=1 Tax=Funneliformis geosporum TaxID=1117311 RepID=A0A9W4WMJ5_9GLOM|nr:8749_t:CDS:2 [Funneliformis geosporum]CAI2173095.1 11956_t:CDS:2 [Funneliformis geosporum]
MSLNSTSTIYGQNETLISSIRNIIKDYPPESVFKEFLQNATRYHLIIDGRSHPNETLLCKEMKAWQGPAILIFNDAIFRPNDFQSLMQIRVGGKQGDDTKIGKHGLGFNSCYHFTDVPSFISGDSIAFLDPLEKNLPKRQGETQRGTIGPFPKNGIGEYLEKDQLVPYEGIEGIDFRSTFKGTLFRIPLRLQPSEISDSIFTPEQIRELFNNLKSNISSQFLFLRNIEKIEISYITEQTVPLQINSIYKAAITGFTENQRAQRKSVINNEIQAFQMDIEQIDGNNTQKDTYIIATGAQPNPESDQLKKYADRYRLRVLGGIAALHKSSKLNYRKEFRGILYSFLSLPDTTYLPFHLNGTWAQGSDRGRLLLEKGYAPDLDHQKLNWNRHIMLEFLPKLYCKLIKKAIELKESDINEGIESIDFTEKIHPISKFWPFPPSVQSNSNYAIEFGFKVLEQMIQKEDLLSNDENYENRVKILFEHLSKNQIAELHYMVRKTWDLIVNPNFKSFARFFPIWRVLTNPLETNSVNVLASASSGYILESNISIYQIKTSKIYLDAYESYDRRILNELNVRKRTTYEYTFEDVEFPKEYNNTYLEYLRCILKDKQVVKNLGNIRCFPNSSNMKLKKATDLYDYNNLVYRAVLGGDSNVFLHHDFSKHIISLSKIGLKSQINQEMFKMCATKVKELQRDPEPPSDIRYRGFMLVDHLYKNIHTLNLENIEGIPFIPITKSMGNPYNSHYKHPQALDCLNDVILPAYREVAWSQMPLIAEDVIPPEKVLKKYPSFGKPDVFAVIRHLRFLYLKLRIDEEWKKGWADAYKNNIYEVYKWLDKECLSNDDIDLSEIIISDPLFLNFNRNQDPFNIENWVSADNLVLNSEPGELKYVNPSLAIYHNMLKNAGAGEITRPDVQINVRVHDQAHHNKSTLFEFLLDQTSTLHDVTFVANGENIKTSRYMLSASSEFFRQKFTSEESSPYDPVTFNIENIEPGSMEILLRYLYGQKIDDAIQSRGSLNDNMGYRVEQNTDHSQNLVTYKNLLKLASDYRLGHLKELMELRLSRLILMSNVNEIKELAESLNASQLNEYCYHFIRDNSEGMS